MPTTTVVPVQPRTVNRGANPFAAIVRQQNQNLTPAVAHNVYEDLSTRGDRVFKHPKVQEEIKNLKARLNGRIYNRIHFGELVWVRFGDMDINIDIQRDEDPVHIAEDILARFDPRLCMVVM